METAARLMENKFFLILVLTLLGCTATEEKTIEINPKANPSSSVEKPLFLGKDPEQTGIFFTNELPEDRYRNILLYQYYYNGGGVAVGDVNNDDLPDIFFTGNLTSNKLYLNRGNWQFEDVTFAAGISPNDGKSWNTGVSMVDINGDGWLDIYVCRSGNFEPQNRRNQLYINNRDGSFTENAGYYGLNDPGYSVQAAFFDYDHDGDLDMFLLNHGMEYYGRTATQDSGERDPFVGDKLYRREADDSYTDVSEEAGILGFTRSYGLGLGVADLNQDGWDDIYVANDFYEHDYLYLNEQDGSFRESVKESTRQISFFGMGVELADFNNDALPDIVVLDMAAEDHVRQKSNLAGISRDKFQDLVDKGYHHQYMFNSLQLNRGLAPDGKPVFSNIARLAGIDKTDWSWAPLLADFDNDGWKDLFISNGLRKDVLNHDFIQNMNTSLQQAGTNFLELPEAKVQGILRDMPSEAVHNYVFQNRGGLRFHDRSRAWGLEEPTFSNGAAYADLDRDGDLDLIVNNLDKPAMLYENRSRQQSDTHFLRLLLEGPPSNPQALGAKVWLYQEGNVQYQQLQTVRGYQSSVEPVLHFGLGENAEVDSLRIIWPGGKQSIYNDFEGDKVVTASYEKANFAGKFDRTGKPWLREVSDQLGLRWTHRENVYDDFDQQFLLPHQLSRQGPALAVADVNADGLEDMYLGSARGFSGTLMVQDSNGRFAATDGPWQDDLMAEDTDALFFDADQDGDMDLYVLSGGVEFSERDPLLQDRLYLNDSNGRFTKSSSLPKHYANSQSITVSDMDNDGDLDIFVGAGSIPGNYPLADQSYLLENQDGSWVDVTDKLAPSLRQSGMVRQACWLEMQAGERPALMVLSAWAAPSVYNWNQGQWKRSKTFTVLDENGKEINAPSGWWTSATRLDIDQDGDQDLLLGNMSMNFRFSASPDAPLELYALDMDENASLELWMAYHQQGDLLPVKERDDIYQQWRDVKRVFPDYAAYAEATLPEILGDQAKDALRLTADTLANMLLINEGNLHFRLRALPDIGQISPLQDAVMVNLNGDARPELITGGNFFPTESQTPRLDASIGQVYEVSDTALSPVPMQMSGLYMPCDVRKLALLRTAGAPLLVVAANGEKLKAFQISTSAILSQNP
jgi:hypothetical protein